jgi:hypothetical protein
VIEMEEEFSGIEMIIMAVSANAGADVALVAA